ncbi:AraC family transcriptional regulator [Dactylosporangium sp. NPDC000244]|uniref:AraC family transcriptional regulator n=1 Tax=Dactylosporangium sp. NPDC000244 TaxID=3154365 RepID=UPI00331D4B42
MAAQRREDAAVHLRRARDLIDREFTDAGLRLEDMAAAALMSKSHFVREFGVTPGAYLSRRRIERTQDLLRFANLTPQRSPIPPPGSGRGSTRTAAVLAAESVVNNAASEMEGVPEDGQRADTTADAGDTLTRTTTVAAQTGVSRSVVDGMS